MMRSLITSGAVGPAVALAAFALMLAAPAAAQSRAPEPAPAGQAADAGLVAADPVAARRCLDRPAAFGCANSANLLVMAAPSDLVGGRPASLPRATQEAAAMARLDAGTVRDLRRESATDASPQ